MRDSEMRIFGAVFAALTLFVLVSACQEGSGESSGAVTEDGAAPAGERVTVGGTEALVWGSGERGVVLSHGAIYDAASWEPQAAEISADGALAVAVEETSAESLEAAAGYLRDEHGVESVAFVGASAGAAPVLEVGRRDPEAVDAMVLLSATGDVSGLGDHPKLFVASEGEGISGQVRALAQEAPGNDNEALILEGDAHAQAIFDTEQSETLMDAMLEFLRESG